MLRPLQGYGTLIHAASASMSDLRSVLRLLVSESALEIVKRAHSPHIDMTVRSTWEEKIFTQKMRKISITITIREII